MTTLTNNHADISQCPTTKCRSKKNVWGKFKLLGLDICKDITKMCFPTSAMHVQARYWYFRKSAKIFKRVPLLIYFWCRWEGGGCSTLLEILTSYLAGTLALGYIFIVQTPQPPLPLPLSTPFSPYIDQNMTIYGLQVMASVWGIRTWFLAKSLLLDIFDDSKLKAIKPLPKEGRGGLFSIPPKKPKYW